jgi:adenine-specific DNA-methyltransferase
VEGLKNNNLRYYKIDFVDRDSSVTAMKKLMVASTDLLCIKQNLYEEKDTFGSIILKPNIARYFNDGVKQMLIIYNTDAIESLVAEIEKMPEDTNIITYVFSTNNYPLNADFEDVADKVSLCALPAAINNAYRNVLPNKLTPKSDDHETETISGE